MEHVILNNGLKMPIVGLGTYPLNRVGLVRSVLAACHCGYSSFDTSSAYGNERWLGIALKMAKVLYSKDLFVTTKLSNADQRRTDVKKALLTSMRRLGLSQIDLYLMHWPNPETYLACWKQMELLYKEGLVKAIGVCNFHEHHLEKLAEIADVVPAVNQIELHPLLTQKHLTAYCEKHGIRIQAYSPVARMHPKLVENPILLSLAAKYHKTVPQIVLRWNVQKKIITIPKSGSNRRIKQNIDIFGFELAPDEMQLIDSMNENFRVRHDPDTADFSKL